MSDSEKNFEFVHYDPKRLKSIQKKFSFILNEKREDTVPVYIRIKPRSDSIKSSFLTFDHGSQTLSIKKKTVKKTYKFTHIFDPETTQQQIFEDCAKPYFKQFLEGQKNVVLFTYGASSSGKTYTILGEPRNPGILPRVIVTLLKSFEGQLDLESPLCPEQATEVAEMTPDRISEYNHHKNRILNLSKSLINMESKKSHNIPFSDIEELVSENERCDIYSNAGVYSLWFSYYEIYNELVHDLLDEPKETRPNLRVISDKNHTYIDGLKHIQINSLQEAFLVYSYGRYNLSVSSTGINDRSSRSHSIFTIKMIGRISNNTNKYFIHSSFSLCDLAGTERADTTGNVGLRLREAQRINASFLTLNRCLRTIRANQNNGSSKCIPYRESKLTKILGPSLTSSDTHLVMIVTVSQSEELLEETDSSLKSSSVAASIKAMSTKSTKPHKKGRLSNLLHAGDVNWNDIASKKCGLFMNEDRTEVQSNDKFIQTGNSFTSFSSFCPESSAPDVYKELEEERKQRKKAEDQLSEVETLFREKIEKLEKNCICNVAEETINILQRKLEEEEGDSMASRAENLKLKKTIRIIKEEKEDLENRIKKLESINKGLNEMLDDAKEDIEELQDEVSELERISKEKEQLIILKDEKLHSLEIDILELEQNLERNANEIEAYDKQLITVEKDLEKKKTELKDLNKKYENVSDELTVSKDEIIRLKEKCQQERNIYSKQLEEAQKLIEEYEKQLKKERNQSKSKQVTIQEGCSENGDSQYVTNSNRKSRTTSKKKKTRGFIRRRKTLDSTQYEGEPVQKEENPGTIKARKKLFQKSSSDYEEHPDILMKTDETLSSPETILRTLRTGKRY